MKNLTAAAGIALIALFSLQPARAQETTTLVLRDGQRLSGELVQMDARGMTLRKNGQERVYPADSVTAIEYIAGTPSAEVASKLKSNHPLIVLKNGQTVEGQLVGIGGDAGSRITFKMFNGEREYTSNEVAQIYLRPLPAAVTLAPGTIAQVVEAGSTLGGMAVPAKDPWTPTTTRVQKGEVIRFSSTGEIAIAAQVRSRIEGNVAATQSTGQYPVPHAPIGALIARIDDGQPFVIGGASQPMTMPASGQLFLGVNDDRFDDNSGQYLVMIVRATSSE